MYGPSVGDLVGDVVGVGDSVGDLVGVVVEGIVVDMGLVLSYTFTVSVVSTVTFCKLQKERYR